MKKLSLHEPLLIDADKRFLNQAFDSTWISGAGKFVDLLEKKISSITSSKDAVACNSGSSGLLISLKALGVKENYEVIVPTITFISTINAVIQNSASPIFMDCDEEFNIDIKKTIDFLKNRTFSRGGFTYNKKTNKKIFAIIIVHCFGYPVILDELVRLCKKKNIFIIEDAAESLGSKYTKGNFKKFHTGTVGDIGVFSFNGNKIITGGGGGVVVSKKKNVIKKIKYLINQAKDDSVKFIHNESGYNYRINNLQSAIIYSQLNRIDVILDKKDTIHELYMKFLDQKKTTLIGKEKKLNVNHWLNVVTLNSKTQTSRNIINILIKNGIEARYVWYPNHLQKPFRKYETYKIKKSLNLVKKSICLPSSLNLKQAEIIKICKLINKFL